MAERKFGVVVAPENKTVRRSQEMVLDTDIDQFKYYKTMQIKRVMPAVDAGNPFQTITIQIRHDLPYTPAFDSFLKGYRGTWGKVLRGAQSLSVGGHAEFPYSGSEWVDGTYYNCSLSVYGGGTAVSAHEIILRVTLLYDEAFA